VKSVRKKDQRGSGARGRQWGGLGEGRREKMGGGKQIKDGRGVKEDRDGGRHQFRVGQQQCEQTKEKWEREGLGVLTPGQNRKRKGREEY